MINKINKKTLFSLLLAGLITAPAYNIYAMEKQYNVDGTHTIATHERISDAHILSEIQKGIKKHITPLSHVYIIVKAGSVKISGTAQTDAEASKIVEISRSIAGVTDVDTSQLKVPNSQHVLADTLITAKIKGLFIQEKLFGQNAISASTITVETKNSVVYLSGVADNQQQINTTVDLAKQVSGVKAVHSNIQLRRSQRNS